LTSKNKTTTVKILSQSFCPDVTGTGQLMFDLAEKLSEDKNIRLSVITGKRPFEKQKRNPNYENFKINRMRLLAINNCSIICKIIDGWIFFICVMLRVLLDRKVDVLLIPTDPPLLPLIGTIAKIYKGQKYIYLMHDVYPEIAAGLGYIKKDGWIYTLWTYLNQISMKHAEKIVVPSQSMRIKLLEQYKNLDSEKVLLVPNWANEDLINVIPKEENHYPQKFNLQDKFIVEYSGNMGRIHEFETIIKAAQKLEKFDDIAFVFIGGGGKKPEVENLVKKYSLKNIMFLPHQDRENLAFSLGMADVHLISLRQNYENLAAPSKLYGILASGKPAIFVGSKNCFITELLENNLCGYTVEIGDYSDLSEKILLFKNSREKLEYYGKNSRELFENNYTLNQTSKVFLELVKS